MTFAERLKNLRKSKKLTQAELATLSGVGLGLISKIERGDNKDPKLSTLEKLINGLGINADMLIPNKDDKGLTGTLKNKLNTLNSLPAEDIRTIVRMIDALSFEELIKTSIVEFQDNPGEKYGQELFIKQIEEREDQEQSIKRHEEETSSQPI